tara:strand:+ start:5923 stop:6396 length:474 start_codon:yes stop_codon:yes gene_type:complete
MNELIMDVLSLIKIKLEKELLNDLSEYYETISDKIDREEYISFIEERIQDKLSENEFFKDTTNKKVIAKENQCCARIMGPRYSDLRCTIISQSESDYCKKHLRRIDQYGYLAFGRFDQERPIINEKGNKIPWRDSSSIEDIDTIIQYQLMNLKKIIQ